MEIKRISEKSTQIGVKKSTIIYDPDLKTLPKNPTALLFPSPVGSGFEASVRLVIDSPGEYEIDDISVQGIDLGPGDQDQIVYRLVNDSTRVVCMPLIDPSLLNEKTLENIGLIDVLVLSLATTKEDVVINIPETVKLVRLLGPRVVIPTGYSGAKSDMEKLLAEIGGQQVAASEFKSKSIPAVGETLLIVNLSVG